MDQDAFRNLLASSGQSQPDTKRRVPTTTHDMRQKATTLASSEPAFKPRKIIKTESKYRDRAAERREGTGNDYAQVEAVLEDFEKRVAHEDKDVIEQQRKYLGGDSQHTILVKGLDMSLLEQNRARAAASTGDDEVLEQAYADATSTSEPTEPRKRTREDIIRDLKTNRQNEERLANQPAVEKSMEGERADLEAGKKAGKFRPIGFKPIGQTREQSKKRKVKEGRGEVKKKPKVENAVGESQVRNTPTKGKSAVSQERGTTESSSSKAPTRPPERESAEVLDEDLDIFAGAGDYEGFQGDEGSEEYGDTERTGAESAPRVAVSPAPAPAVGFRGWFDEPEAGTRDAPVRSEKSPSVPEAVTTEGEVQEMCLEPLESSAISSIRDFLAMDEAVEKAEKRRARKEKKKKKKKEKAGDDDDN